jgi:hypothetical protein
LLAVAVVATEVAVVVVNQKVMHGFMAVEVVLEAHRVGKQTTVEMDTRA